jgi:hypothetical protein
MGYMHIDNLYKNQAILKFAECYALEKVHGTSTHIAWNGGLSFHSGGEPHARFVALFDAAQLTAAFEAFGESKVIVYGEAYGGKQQGMRATYGDDLRFIVFDVKVDDTWLDVPRMAAVAASLGFEVVPWERTTTDLAAIDAIRDRPSEVAIRRGCGDGCAREGIVLRPIVETVIGANSKRLIAKHKGTAFSERATTPKAVSPENLIVLQQAQAIADEWVTDMRLSHVLDKLPPVSIEDTRTVLDAMVADIYREAAGEIVESREATTAICRKTAQLFKAHLQRRAFEG